jgi:hypothetical protein
MEFGEAVHRIQDVRDSLGWVGLTHQRIGEERMERQAKRAASSRYARTLTLLGLAAGLFLAAAVIPPENDAAAQPSKPTPSTALITGTFTVLKHDIHQPPSFDPRSGFPDRSSH